MSVLVRLPVDFLLLKMVYVLTLAHHLLSVELMKSVKPLRITHLDVHPVAMLSLLKPVQILVTVLGILYAYLHQEATVLQRVVIRTLIVQEIAFANYSKGFLPV